MYEATQTGSIPEGDFGRRRGDHIGQQKLSLYIVKNVIAR